MIQKTLLEFVVCRVLKCRDLSSVSQEELDAATPEIMERVSPEDIIDHTIAVYDETADDYLHNPHNRFVTDDLIKFMSMLREKDAVLDLGCGLGRDACFMASSDAAYRASLMQRETNGRKTIEEYLIPTHALRVMAVDASKEMIAAAIGDGTARLRCKYPPKFYWKDMHHDLRKFEKGMFKGVWSCASFLTHTPQSLMEPAIADIASVISRGGVFAVSYTQRQPGTGYDCLKLSSTGRIKYFSHPSAAEVAACAQWHGLSPMRQATSDYVDEARGKTIPNLFVTQFFVKQ